MFIARSENDPKQLGAASSDAAPSEMIHDSSASINIALLTERLQRPLVSTYYFVSLSIALRNSSGLIFPKCLKTTWPVLS